MGAIYNIIIRWVYTGEPEPRRIIDSLVPLLLQSVGYVAPERPRRRKHGSSNADAPAHTPAEQYGRLVSVSLPTPDLSVEAFLRHARGQQARFYWRDGRDPVVFAGVGIAAELMAWGENRYETIAQKAASLFENAFVDTADESMARPRLFGGFAFRDDFIPDNTWASFHPAHFVLPHYQLLQRGGEVWLTINAHLPTGEDSPKQVASLVPDLREALVTEYALLRSFTAEDNAAPPQYELRYPMSQAQWTEMLNSATSLMREQPDVLAKVVLSRVSELRTQDGRPADIDGALAYLNQHYPGCYRFLFELRPGHAFYGATPELLAQVSGEVFVTMGLAGSERRGENGRRR